MNWQKTSIGTESPHSRSSTRFYGSLAPGPHFTAIHPRRAWPPLAAKVAPSFAATDSPPSPACRPRDVGVLYGVYPGCAMDVPLENVLVQAEGFLTKSV